MRPDSARHMQRSGQPSTLVTIIAIVIGVPIIACLGALFIGALVIGANHLGTAKSFDMGSDWHEAVSTCPAQPLTAIYMFVQGILSLVFPMVVCLAASTAYATANGKNKDGTSLQCIDALLKGLVAVSTAFLLVWTLLGAVWILGAAWPDPSNLSSPAYCDSLLYYWAFALVVTMATICVLASPIAACVLLMGAADPRSQANTGRAHAVKGIIDHSHNQHAPEDEQNLAGYDQQSLKNASATPVDFLPSWRHDEKHSMPPNTSNYDIENRNNLNMAAAMSAAIRRETPV